MTQKQWNSDGHGSHCPLSPWHSYLAPSAKTGQWPPASPSARRTGYQDRARTPLPVPSLVSSSGFCHDFCGWQYWPAIHSLEGRPGHIAHVGPQALEGSSQCPQDKPPALAGGPRPCPLTLRASLSLRARLLITRELGRLLVPPKLLLFCQSASPSGPGSKASLLQAPQDSAQPIRGRFMEAPTALWTQLLWNRDQGRAGPDSLPPAWTCQRRCPPVVCKVTDAFRKPLVSKRQSGHTLKSRKMAGLEGRRPWASSAIGRGS